MKIINKDIVTPKLITYFYAFATWLALAFMVFIYWFNVNKDEAGFENFISQTLVSYYDFVKKGNGDTTMLKSRIIKELDIQVSWEWKHERFNRSVSQAAAFLNYFLNAVILGMTILLLSNREVEKGRLSVSKSRLKFLIGISVFQLIVSTYIGRENLDLKQRAHDYRARELQTIRTGLELEIISNEKAWEDFREVYRISPQDAYIKTLDRSRYSQ